MKENRLKRTRSVADTEQTRADDSEGTNNDLEISPALSLFINDFLGKLSQEEMVSLIDLLKEHLLQGLDQEAGQCLEKHLYLLFANGNTLPDLSDSTDEEAPLTPSGDLPHEAAKTNVIPLQEKKSIFHFLQEDKNPASKDLITFFDQELEENEERDVLLQLAGILSPYWKQLLEKVNSPPKDELKLVQELQGILTAFLTKISEVQHPVRKRLLLFLARSCNEYLDKFEFISPEYYAKVDPTYHNVLEEVGSRIKIGYSFLVIRKANYQVVFKADVVTY